MPSADRFAAFWAALEALDGLLLRSAPRWAGEQGIVPSQRDDGAPRKLRGVATLVQTLYGSDELFREAYRFRNDLLHGNTVPPLGGDPIEGRDVRVMQWVIEGFQRILDLDPAASVTQQWRQRTEDFRVLGNVRIVVEGQFWRLSERYVTTDTESVPIRFGMGNHSKILCIRFNSRDGVDLTVKRVLLWGARQYLTLDATDLTAQIVDDGQKRRKPSGGNSRR